MTEDLKLPEGWKLVKLGEVAERIKEVHPKGSQPYLEIGDVDIKSKRYAIKEKPSPEHCLRVRKNYIVISKVRPMRGAIAKIKEEYLYVSPALLVLNSDNNDFLFYALSKEDFFNYLGTRETGTTYPSVNDSDILDFEFLFPSISEQRKIAEILETVDETIEKTDAIIEKYKRIKQGLMQDLLTRGITAFEFEKDKIIVAIKKVFNDGDHKIGREENLVSHLSRHLDDFFPKWDIDSEVNKNKERQRPDIIVHKRGTDNNLFAIEVKKNDNLNAIKEDIKKLENVMLGDYYYEDVVFIGFDIENFEDVFKLSEKANFILVSKNGEIKVKTRVRRFKESPLGRIPEEWEAYQIADVANVTKLAGFEFTNYFRYRDDGEIIALRALNIKNRKLDLTDIQRVKKEVSEQLPRSQVNAGDILITYIGAYIGDTLLIKESNKYHLAPNVAKITTKSIILPEFLEIFLSSYIGKKQYKQFSTLTATPSLTMTQIRKIIIFFPTEKEQHRIFSILSQIDKTIEREQKYKERLEKIKQGLMEDLLTGEVRTNYLIKEGVESV
jgi:restriction endonuclease S subunit